MADRFKKTLCLFLAMLFTSMCCYVVYSFTGVPLRQKIIEYTEAISLIDEGKVECVGIDTAENIVYLSTEKDSNEDDEEYFDLKNYAYKSGIPNLKKFIDFLKKHTNVNIKILK